MKKLFWGTLLSFVFILSGCSNDFSWLDSNETILSAHRGAHTVAPENTVEAIHSAIELGYGAVEIDPRVSKDGKIFLMHDDTVDRTTNGKGPLEQLISDQVKELEINTKEYPKYSGKVLRVPTFDQAIEQLSDSELILNVDGSKGDWTDKEFVTKIVEKIKSHGIFEKTFFVLSSEDERKFMNNLYPDACLSWLVSEDSKIESEIKKAKEYKHALLSISDKMITEEMVNKLNESGVYYQIYGVNSQERFELLKQWKVKMIETDSIVP